MMSMMSKSKRLEMSKKITEDILSYRIGAIFINSKGSARITLITKDRQSAAEWLNEISDLILFACGVDVLVEHHNSYHMTVRPYERAVPVEIFTVFLPESYTEHYSFIDPTLY